MPIPIEEITEAKLPSELSVTELEALATALNIDAKTHSETTISVGTSISFTLGVPLIVFIDGQKVDNWKPSTGWNSETEMISNIPYTSGAFIEVLYREAY